MDDLTQQNNPTTPPTNPQPADPNVIQPLVSPTHVEAEPPTPAPVETPVELTPTESTFAPTVPTEPTPQLSVTSEQPKNGILQMLMENKKIVIIGVVALVAIIIGISIFIGAKSSDEYQGLIKRIETETQDLNKAGQTNISAPAVIENSIPFEMEGLPEAKVQR